MICYSNYLILDWYIYIRVSLEEKLMKQHPQTMCIEPVKSSFSIIWLQDHIAIVYYDLFYNYIVIITHGMSVDNS